MKKIINWKQQRNGQISNESSPEKRSTSTWHHQNQLNQHQLPSNDQNAVEDLSSTCASASASSGSILAAAAHSHDLRLRSSAISSPSSVGQGTSNPSTSKLTLPRVGANSPNSGEKSVYTFDDEDDDGNEDFKSLFANKRPIVRISHAIGAVGVDGSSGHSAEISSVSLDSRVTTHHASHGPGPDGDGVSAGLSGDGQRCGSTNALSPKSKSPVPVDCEMTNGLGNASDSLDVDELVEENIVDGFAILSFSCQEDLELWVEKKTPRPPKEEEASNLPLGLSSSSCASTAPIRPKARRARTLPIPCSGIDTSASHCIGVGSVDGTSESVNGNNGTLSTLTSSPCSLGPTLSTNSVLPTTLPVSGAPCSTSFSSSSDKNVNFSGSPVSFRQVQRSSHNRFHSPSQYLHHQSSQQQQSRGRQSPPPAPPPSAVASCGSSEHLRRTPDSSPLHEAVTRLLMQTVDASDSRVSESRHHYDTPHIHSKSSPSPSPTSDYQLQTSSLAQQNFSASRQRHYSQDEAVITSQSKDVDLKPKSATKSSPSSTPLRPPPPLLEASKAHGVHPLGASSLSSTSVVPALPPLQRFPPPPLDIPSAASSDVSRCLKRTESVDSVGPLTGGSGSKLSPPKLSPVKPILTPTSSSASLPPPLLYSGRGSNGTAAAQHLLLHSSPVLNSPKDLAVESKCENVDGNSAKHMLKLEEGDPNLQKLSRGMAMGFNEQKHFLGVVEAAHSALSAAAQLPSSSFTQVNAKGVEESLPPYAKTQNISIGSSARSSESHISDINASASVTTTDFSNSKPSTSVAGDDRNSISRHQAAESGANTSLSVSSLLPNFSVSEFTPTGTNDRSLRHPSVCSKNNNNAYPSLSSGCSTTSVSCYSLNAHHHNQQQQHSVGVSSQGKRRTSPSPNFSYQSTTNNSSDLQSKRHRSGGSGSNNGGSSNNNTCIVSQAPPAPFLPPPPTRTSSASVGVAGSTPLSLSSALPGLSVGIPNNNQRALSAGPSSNSMFTSVHSATNIDSAGQAMAAAAAAGILPSSGRFTNPATAAAVAAAAVAAASSGHGAAAAAAGHGVNPAIADAKSLHMLQMIGGTAPGGPVSAHDLLHAEQYLANLSQHQQAQQRQSQSQQSSPVAAYQSSTRSRSGGTGASSNEFNSLLTFSSQQQQQQQHHHPQQQQQQQQQQQFFEKLKYDPNMCRQMIANFSSPSGYPSLSALPSVSHNAYLGVTANSNVAMGTHGAFQPKNGYFSQGGGVGSVRSVLSLPSQHQASAYLQHPATAHPSHARQHNHPQHHLSHSPSQIHPQQQQVQHHSHSISPHHQYQQQQQQLRYPATSGPVSAGGCEIGSSRRHLRPSSANAVQSSGNGGGKLNSCSGDTNASNKSFPLNPQLHIGNSIRTVKAQHPIPCGPAANENKPSSGHRASSKTTQLSPNSQASTGNTATGVTAAAATQRRPSLWCSMHVKIAWYIHQFRQARQQPPLQSSRPEPPASVTSSGSSSSSNQPQLHSHHHHHHHQPSVNTQPPTSKPPQPSPIASVKVAPPSTPQMHKHVVSPALSRASSQPPPPPHVPQQPGAPSPMAAGINGSTAMVAAAVAAAVQQQPPPFAHAPAPPPPPHHAPHGPSAPAVPPPPPPVHPLAPGPPSAAGMAPHHVTASQQRLLLQHQRSAAAAVMAAYNQDSWSRQAAIAAAAMAQHRIAAGIPSVPAPPVSVAPGLPGYPQSAAAAAAVLSHHAHAVGGPTGPHRSHHPAHHPTHHPGHHHPWLQGLPSAPPHPSVAAAALGHSAAGSHHQQSWSYHFEQLKNAARAPVSSSIPASSDEPASKRSRVSSGRSSGYISGASSETSADGAARSSSVSQQLRRSAEDRDREQWERKRKLHVYGDSRKQHQHNFKQQQPFSHHSSTLAHTQSTLASKSHTSSSSQHHHHHHQSVSTSGASSSLNTVTAAVVSVPPPVVTTSESVETKVDSKNTDTIFSVADGHTTKRIDVDLEIIEQPSDLTKVENRVPNSPPKIKGSSESYNIETSTNNYNNGNTDYKSRNVGSDKASSIINSPTCDVHISVPNSEENKDSKREDAELSPGPSSPNVRCSLTSHTKRIEENRPRSVEHVKQEAEIKHGNKDTYERQSNIEKDKSCTFSQLDSRENKVSMHHTPTEKEEEHICNVDTNEKEVVITNIHDSVDVTPHPDEDTSQSNVPGLKSKDELSNNSLGRKDNSCVTKQNCDSGANYNRENSPPSATVTVNHAEGSSDRSNQVNETVSFSSQSESPSTINLTVVSSWENHRQRTCQQPFIDIEDATTHNSGVISGKSVIEPSNNAVIRPVLPSSGSNDINAGNTNNEASVSPCH